MNHVVPNSLYPAFAAAYRAWLGIGPRGDALLSFASEVAKGSARSDSASMHDGASAADAIVTALFVLDEAWRRHYGEHDMSEAVLLEILELAVLERRRGHRGELERVRLTRPVSAFYEPGVAGFETTREIPSGANGTVVAVLDAGQGYDVEFTEPFPAIATVQDSDLS